MALYTVLTSLSVPRRLVKGGNILLILHSCKVESRTIVELEGEVEELEVRTGCGEDES